MAFIPIDAKADIEGSKKGKLTPAQHSQLNAWCLTKKTGILNCLNRCEATANMYTATNNIATVIFKSGYLAICGRIVECEEGTEVQVRTPVSGTQTGYIIARYDLSASQDKEFEIITKTGALVQQDLNDNPITGIYELLLYSYTATATSVTLNRSIEYIKSISDIVPRAVTAKYMEETYLNPSASNPVDLNDLTEYGVYNIQNYNEQVPYVYNAPEQSVGRIIVSSFLLVEADSSINTPYNVLKQEFYSFDNYYYRYSSHNPNTGEHTGWTDWVKVGISTIEERLNALGFKEGSITDFVNGATLTKMGGYAILKIPEIRVTSNGATYVAEMSFSAKDIVTFTMGGTAIYGGGYYRGDGTIEGNTLTLNLRGGSYGADYGSTQIGFEIDVTKE